MELSSSSVRYVTALTLRESEVLRHVDAGSSNSEIAEALNISRDGVKYHLKSIYAKLGARRRTEAVRLARRHALISSNDEPLRTVVIA